MPSTVTETFAVYSRPSSSSSSPIRLHVGNSWIVCVFTTDNSFSFHADLNCGPPYYHLANLPRSTHVTFEILDQAGEHVLFRRAQMVHHYRSPYNPLTVDRDELEGASCIRCNNTFTLRCTMSLPKPADGKIMRWYRRLRGSKPEDVVVLSESRTITIGSFSKIRAASQVREFYAHSTRLMLGKDLWELRLCPNGYDAWDQVTLSLARHAPFADNHDESAVMLRFRFELHAGVHGQKFDESVEVTHGFSRGNPHMTSFKMPITSLMAKLGGGDRLIIRWWFAILPAVPATTTVPIAPAAEAQESVLTPLLRAMYVGDYYC